MNHPNKAVEATGYRRLTADVVQEEVSIKTSKNPEEE
jgi:hypothetical protein